MSDRRDPIDDAFDSGPTPHRPWVRIVTVVVLAVFVLSIVVGSLLL